MHFRGMYSRPVSNLRRFQSDNVSSSSSSSSSMSSPSSPSPPSCCRVTVRDLWKRGLMSCSLSGIASSSSTSPWRTTKRKMNADWTLVKRKRGKSGGRCLLYGISDLSSGWLTFRRIMSISEYFIPFTRIGINLKKRESHDYTDKTQYFLQPLNVTSLP